MANEIRMARLVWNPSLDAEGGQADADDGHESVRLERPVRLAGADLGRVGVAPEARRGGPDRPVVVRHVFFRTRPGVLVPPGVRHDLVQGADVLRGRLVLRVGGTRLDELVVVPLERGRPVGLAVPLELLQGLELLALRVQLADDEREERPAGGVELLVGEPLGPPGVHPEAPGHEQEDAGPQQPAALPLQAGFPEQPLEGAVGHEESSQLGAISPSAISCQPERLQSPPIAARRGFVFSG